jgi:hypothetical protein
LAETVSLGSKQDTSTWPSVFIAPENLERAESFVEAVTAEPVQAVQFQDYISCTRGSETISLQTGPLRVDMPAGRKRHASTRPTAIKGTLTRNSQRQLNQLRIALLLFIRPHPGWLGCLGHPARAAGAAGR